MLRGTSLMPYIQLLQTVQPLWKYDVALWVRSLWHNRDAGVQLPTLHILRNEFHALMVTTSNLSSSVSGFNSRCHHSLEDAGKGNPGSRRPTRAVWMGSVFASLASGPGFNLTVTCGIFRDVDSWRFLSLDTDFYSEHSTETQERDYSRLGRYRQMGKALTY